MTISLLAFPLLACGTSTEMSSADPDPAPANCGRLEVVDGEGCRPVEVTGMREEQVQVERGGWSMPGVLTLPETSSSDYRAPVVVLIHGSGPQSRHGALTGSLAVDFGTPVEVYRSFADQMAARGVATLRYDKRSCFNEAVPDCANRVADYPGDINAILVDDFVEDARAAVHSLAGHPDVAENDVIVAGHSQGGSFVPHLVATEPSVTAGIGLAAPALPLVDTIAGQVRVAADHLASVDATAYAQDIAQLRALADQYEDELTQVLAGTWSEPTWLGASPAFWQNSATWFERAETDLLQVEAPLLYLSGDLDFNVWPAHLERYAELGTTQQLDLTTELFPGVTHAFVPVTGTPPADHTIDPRFSPAVIDRIVAWLASE